MNQDTYNDMVKFIEDNFLDQDGLYETEYDGRMYTYCHGCSWNENTHKHDDDCAYIQAPILLLNAGSLKAQEKKQEVERIILCLPTVFTNVCPVCNTRFNSQKGVIDHMRGKHLIYKDRAHAMITPERYRTPEYNHLRSGRINHEIAKLISNEATATTSGD